MEPTDTDDLFTRVGALEGELADTRQALSEALGLLAWLLRDITDQNDLNVADAVARLDELSAFTL